jgi:large subunit ribosomal protein L1
VKTDITAFIIIYSIMAKRGKAYRAAREKVSATTKYPLAEAVALTKEVSVSKFVGAVELHIKTGANPKYNDQMVRGTVVLPHGTGKTVRVAAFVADDKRDEATAAGADLVGNQEILEAIQN